MQGYLKFKENDEELYETEIYQKIQQKKKETTKYMKHIFSIISFIVKMYLNLIVYIKKCFYIITVKEIYSGLIFILPHKKQVKRYIPKLKKLMKNYKISTLVLAEELRNNETFLKEFQKDRTVEKQIHILNGKEIMPYLIQEIIQYILQKQGRTTALEDLYLLIKKENSTYKENIAYLTQHFKTVNIVTPCLKAYQNLANQLEEKYNTMITVTNNKKKSMRKAKWIVNFDMQESEIKKYTIYRTATIMYLENSELYKENTFNGIHICRAGIDVSEEIKDFFQKQNLLNQCPITILYESTIIKKRNFNLIKEQMKKDKVKINTLYGTRGILSKIDYEKVKESYE